MASLISAGTCTCKRGSPIKEYLPRELAGRSSDRASVAAHSQDEGAAFRFGLEQFLREARTLAQLDHPNIVRVRHFFEANGTAYLVMDYYQGLSLAEYVEQQGGRLEEKLAIQLLMPVLDGLRAVHAKGFLHRDVKPANIYLARMDSGGVRPILLDFGAARQAMSERSRSLSVVVSAGYAPFEQYQRRGNQGPWTDVYSVAAVLYRLVTGEPPPEAIERVSGDEIKPAASFGVSTRLSDALGEALALAPEARPQTVPEFQVRLWGAKPPQEPDPAPTSPNSAAAPIPEHRWALSAPPASPKTEKGSASLAGSGSPPRRWLWPAVLAVVVVLLTLLLGLAGWYQHHQDQIAAQLRQAADDRAFETAVGMNTGAAYRAYLSACASDGCGHRPQAEQRLHDLTAKAQAEVEHLAQERAQQEAKRQAATEREALDNAAQKSNQQETAARQVPTDQLPDVPAKPLDGHKEGLGPAPSDRSNITPPLTEPVYPASAGKLKSLELGEAVLLFMPDNASEPIPWDFRVDAPVVWLTDGYKEDAMPNGETFSHRDGLMRIHVQGTRSHILKNQRDELAWTISYSTRSSPRFGVELVTIEPGAPGPAVMCFGTLFDGCVFEPRKSFISI